MTKKFNYNDTDLFCMENVPHGRRDHLVSVFPRFMWIYSSWRRVCRRSSSTPWEPSLSTWSPERFPPAPAPFFFFFLLHRGTPASQKVSERQAHWRWDKSVAILGARVLFFFFFFPDVPHPLLIITMCNPIKTSDHIHKKVFSLWGTFQDENAQQLLQSQLHLTSRKLLNTQQL